VADRHLDPTLPHLRVRWWMCVDPWLSRHEGAGSTHIRCWVLLMIHIASWPVPPEVPPSDGDTYRWNNAVIRKGRGGSGKKAKGQGPALQRVGDYLEQVCVRC